MKRLKVLTKFNLSEDELEKIVGGVDMSTMDYGGCSVCMLCDVCTICTFDCTLCTGSVS